jgi:DNA-binding response OmpR family regulator
MPSTILVAEDQADIRDLLVMNLRNAGYEVAAVADGLAALASQNEQASDLLILDLMMPGMDGLEVCKALRARGRSAPILMLTAKSTELDRVLGLELGADDYLCKPFSMRELVARVKVLFRRAAIRRQPPAAPRELRAGDMRLDLDRYEARWGEKPVPLTVTEFRLLHALARHPGHVKTRAQLLAEAYPEDTFVSDRTIDSHVKRLRRKFEGVDTAFDLLETVYGLGYRWRERARSGS